MNSLYIVKIIQIIFAALLTFLVLIQSKGTGLSSVFGGVTGQYRTKRGLEKGLFGFTVFLGIAFVINSVLIVVLN